MVKRLLLLAMLAIIGFAAQAFAQTPINNKHPLTYFLPDIEYDSSIPTPEQFFGFQIGEWRLTHDRQYQYIKMVAEKSPRIQLVEYARSYERHPLVYLIITSEKNQQNIDNIKAQHQALCDPARSGSIDISSLPAVLYQGFSIQGNESSGGNAAPLVVYYLAAGKSPDIDKLLDNVVILLDQRYDIAVTKGDMGSFSRFDLHRYNVIIMSSGSYNDISQSGVDNLRDWLQNGGTLIAVQRATQWLRSKGLSSVEIKRDSGNDNDGRRPYGRM